MTFLEAALVTARCAWCAAAFSRRRRSHRYCSIECRQKAWAARNPLWWRKRPKQIRVLIHRACVFCGKTFLPVARTTVRYCSSGCIQAAWSQRHPLRRKEVSRAWAARNKESQAKNLKEWRKRNPAKVKAQLRRVPKERQRLQSQRWRDANPDKVRDMVHRRRLRVKQGGPVHVNYTAIMERDRGICAICGKKVKQSEISFDHILPLSRGGQHKPSNLRLAHRLCNIRRSSYGVAQLRFL